MDSFVSAFVGAFVGFIFGCVLLVSCWTSTMDEMVKTKFFTRNGSLYHVAEIHTK